MRVVCARHVRGMRVACVWRARGMRVACAWHVLHGAATHQERHGQQRVRRLEAAALACVALGQVRRTDVAKTLLQHSLVLQADEMAHLRKHVGESVGE